METSPVSPAIPLGFEILTVIVPVLGLAIAVVALISLTRTSGLSTTARAVWIAVIVFAAFIGPLAWLLIGRRKPGEVSQCK